MFVHNESLNSINPHKGEKGDYNGEDMSDDDFKECMCVHDWTRDEGFEDFKKDSLHLYQMLKYVVVVLYYNSGIVVYSALNVTVMRKINLCRSCYSCESYYQYNFVLFLIH